MKKKELTQEDLDLIIRQALEHDIEVIPTKEGEVYFLNEDYIIYI